MISVQLITSKIANHIRLCVCGKREAHRKWSMVIPEKAAPVTGTTWRTILALRRRILGSERHRYAIA